MTHKRVVLSLISCLLVLNTGQLDAKDTEEHTTGVQIGTIIKDAVQTAVPVIPALLDAIWKGKAEKIKKDEANKEQLKATLAQSTTQATKQLRELDQVVYELDLLGDFLDPAVKADASVRKMITLTPLEKWSVIDEEWIVALANIQSLKGVGANKLTNLRSMWLKDRLKRILDLNNDSAIRVSSRLKYTGTKDEVFKGDLLAELTKVSDTLSDIHVVVGLEIDELSTGLKAATSAPAASTPAPSVGFSSPVPTGEPPDRFLRILEQRDNARR